MKYKWHTFGMLLMTPIVVFIFRVLTPYIFANMVGTISSGLPAEEIVSTLLPTAITFLVIYFISETVLEKLRLYWCWKIELLCMYDLGLECFNTICAQSMQFHNDRFSGSLVSQVNKFTGAFERFVDVLIWDAIPLATGVILSIVILWTRTPLFALSILAFVILYTLVTGLTSRKQSRLSSEEAAAYTKTTGQLADSVTNITSVKSYSREAYETRRYSRFMKNWQSASFKYMFHSIRRNIVFSVVEILLVIALIFFMLVGRSWFGLSVSTLVLIITYSQQILNSIWDVTHIFKNITRSLGDAYEMTEILDLPDDVVDAPNAYTMKPKHSTVEFSHVDFRHQDAKEAIFHDFNLNIKEGERIGLVGVSGSGKTTLTKLLLRFADVNGGEISIDGNNIKEVTQKSLREYISYVPQETSLFHRSIADNIAYAKPDASRAEIIRAAKLANADEFIKDTPDGYDTLVGERGIKLSGGQRQRIAIARAILKDAPILILDEATSALDSESEALIQDALKTLMKGRTSIVIAHRLSTVAELDRIVVLEDGKIVEQGSHHQLLLRDGPYKKLWSRQSGAFME